MTGRAVLVTGGASFLGKHLVPKLAADGWIVRVLDRVAPPAWVSEEGASYRQGDVCDGAAVRGAMDGVDAVVHAAFAPPSWPTKEIVRVNVAGTRTVLAAALALGSPKVVLVSSTIVQRPLSPHPLAAEAPLSRLHAYRKSRVAAEFVASRAGASGLPVAVARPKTFLGPGGIGGFAVIFELVRRGGVVPLLGLGSNRYQLIDVRDLADGLSRLAGSHSCGYFNFGAARFGTVVEDLAAVAGHAGTGASPRLVPPTVARAGLRAVELAGLPPLAEWHQACARGEDSVVDTEGTRAALGWQPFRSNADALIDSYDWFAAATMGGGAPLRPVPHAHRALAWMASVAGRISPGEKRARVPSGPASGGG